MMHKKLTYFLTISMILSVATASYIYRDKAVQPKVLNQAQVETQPIVTRTFTDHVSGYGVIQSLEYITLKSLHTNKITHIGFNGGEKVSAGQVLLKLDTRTANAQLAQDNAQLIQIKHNWQRQFNLHQKNLVSQSEYDDSYSSYEQAKALIAEDTALLSELTIKAPFAGIISLTDFHVGDLLDAGTPVATLYNPNQLTVTYQLPISKASTYKIGQIIEVQSELDPSKHSSGKVTYISPNIRSGFVTLKANVTKGANFKPGQNVKVVQQTKQLLNQVVIPTASLLTNLEGSQAFIVENGKATLRDVKVGRYGNGYVQILSGLKAGEELVINGQHFLHSDQSIVVNNGAKAKKDNVNHSLKSSVDNKLVAKKTVEAIGKQNSEVKK